MILVLAVACLVLAGAGCSGHNGFSTGHNKFSEEQHGTYTLTEKGRIDLDNVNGQVRIVAWEGNAVQLDAVKRASSQEYLKEVEVRIEASEDELKVRTIQPSTKGFWGIFNRGGSAQVDYTLQVPAHIRLDSISTVNGSVRIENMGADVKASTVNGSLHVTAAGGSVRLSTVNGSVNAAVDPEEGKSIYMKTVNGSLSLALPPDISADLAANTVNGKINCDFAAPLNDKSVVGHELETRLGDGAVPIRLETVNGKISILKTAMRSLEAPVER